MSKPKLVEVMKCPYCNGEAVKSKIVGEKHINWEVLWRGLLSSHPSVKTYVWLCMSCGKGIVTVDNFIELQEEYEQKKIAKEIEIVH